MKKYLGQITVLKEHIDELNHVGIAGQAMMLRSLLREFMCSLGLEQEVLMEKEKCHYVATKSEYYHLDQMRLGELIDVEGKVWISGNHFLKFLFKLTKDKGNPAKKEGVDAVEGRFSVAFLPNLHGRGIIHIPRLVREVIGTDVPPDFEQ